MLKHLFKLHPNKFVKIIKSTFRFFCKNTFSYSEIDKNLFDNRLSLCILLQKLHSEKRNSQSTLEKLQSRFYRANMK